MTHTLRAVEVGSEQHALAEGVIWDDRARRVRWVDILGHRVLSARLDGDRLDDIVEVPVGETVGAVALAEDGGLLIAAARRLMTLASDGTLADGPALLADDIPSRLNDGAVDPQGRFLVGTAPTAQAGTTEVLVRVSPDGEVETLRTGLELSNGLGWSPDGGTIYHIDTYASTLSSHSYGPGEFDHDEPWRVLVSEFPGGPDGMRVDAEGMLWVAQYGAGCVVRFASDGREIARVELDARQPTCPGFVGDALDRLVITTAIEHLADDDRVPGDGRLFVVDPGVAGVPVNRWAGSTTASTTA